MFFYRRIVRITPEEESTVTCPYCGHKRHKPARLLLPIRYDPDWCFFWAFLTCFFFLFVQLNMGELFYHLSVLLDSMWNIHIVDPWNFVMLIVGLICAALSLGCCYLLLKAKYWLQDSQSQLDGRKCQRCFNYFLVVASNNDMVGEDYWEDIDDEND